jgi:hypothetical protein
VQRFACAWQDAGGPEEKLRILILLGMTTLEANRERIAILRSFRAESSALQSGDSSRHP